MTKRLLLSEAAAACSLALFGDKQRPPGVPVCSHIWTEITLRLSQSSIWASLHIHRISPKDGELEDTETFQDVEWSTKAKGRALKL